MTIEEAIEILRKHNEWRRYNGDLDDSVKSINPKLIGEAIDLIVNHYNKTQNSAHS